MHNGLKDGGVGRLIKKWKHAMLRCRVAISYSLTLTARIASFLSFLNCVLQLLQRPYVPNSYKWGGGEGLLGNSGRKSISFSLKYSMSLIRNININSVQYCTGNDYLFIFLAMNFDGKKSQDDIIKWKGIFQYSNNNNNKEKLSDFNPFKLHHFPK